MHTNILSDRIRELRKGKGWSTNQLAAKLDLGQPSIFRWESGDSIPNAARIIALAMLFEVSSDYLLGLSDSPIKNWEVV